MNETIIDGLFYGGITAFGRHVTPSEEHKRIDKKIEDECRYFVSKMSVDDCKRFEELSNLYSQSNLNQERDAFGYGVRLGVMLMCEVFFLGESSPVEQKQ